MRLWASSDEADHWLCKESAQTGERVAATGINPSTACKSKCRQAHIWAAAIHRLSLNSCPPTPTSHDTSATPVNNTDAGRRGGGGEKGWFDYMSNVQWQIIRVPCFSCLPGRISLIGLCLSPWFSIHDQIITDNMIVIVFDISSTICKYLLGRLWACLLSDDTCEIGPI